MGTRKYVCCLRSRGKAPQEAKSYMVKDVYPHVRDLCTALGALCVLCPPLSAPLSYPPQSRMSPACLRGRPLSFCSCGTQDAQRLHPLSLPEVHAPCSWFQCPFLMNILYFTRKPLRSLADRMLLIETSALSLFMSTVISMCACVCVCVGV